MAVGTGLEGLMFCFFSTTKFKFYPRGQIINILLRWLILASIRIKNVWLVISECAQTCGYVIYLKSKSTVKV